jgi:hypothetical protein
MAHKVILVHKEEILVHKEEILVHKEEILVHKEEILEVILEVNLRNLEVLSLEFHNLIV